MPKKNKIDIVLVNPASSPEQEFGFLTVAGSPRPPLNLLNLAAIILERGYTASIVDAFTMNGDIENVSKAILSNSPRCVGFTAVTAFIQTAAEIAAKIKRFSPDIITIVGGAHVTALPEETLEIFPSFDIGVVGEGDITIAELIEGLEHRKDLSKITGLVLRTNNEPLRTAPRKQIENLDTLPMPAWHLLPNYSQIYQPTLARRTRLPSAYIVTSRGCPFFCSFCNNIVHGLTFRSYSVNYIMKIVDYMVTNYRVADLTIYDENLLLRRNRILDLCKSLIRADYRLTWSCDARADCVDEETLSLMYKAGCRCIWYGMESGNAKILQSYNKRLDLESIEKATRLTKKYGINVSGSFIIGGPGETPQTIKDTICFAKKIKLDAFVPYFYTPTPGMSDYNEIREKGTMKTDYRLATMVKPIFAPHGMSFSDVYYWYIHAVISWYLRPHILLAFIRYIGIFNIFKIGFSFLKNGIVVLSGFATKQRRYNNKKLYKDLSGIIR